MARSGLRILFVMLLSLAVIALYLYRDSINFARIHGWVAEAGVWGALLFMGIYALATLLFFPTVLVALAGGVLFGPVLGTIYTLTGATSGAVAAFIIARYLAGGWLQRRSDGRLKQITEGVGREGWRFVAMVRLVPFSPFCLSNYLLGLTRISLLSFLITTFICLLPAALTYTYLGYVGGEAIAGGEDVLEKGLLALGFLILVGYLPRLLGLLGIGLNIRAHLNHREP